MRFVCIELDCFFGDFCIRKCFLEFEELFYVFWVNVIEVNKEVGCVLGNEVCYFDDL